jgi:hypothetical protein
MVLAATLHFGRTAGARSARWTSIVVLRKMEQEAPTNIVFLGACRNNSLAVPVLSPMVSRRQCEAASAGTIVAVTEVAPLSPPMIRVE